MDVYLVVLRLIHIVAAVIWVGGGALSARFMLPAAKQAGAEGQSYIRSLLTSTRFGMVFGIAAGVTVLAGILLYLRPGASGKFSSLGWGALSIGALVGLLAAGHGGAVMGRLAGQYLAALQNPNSTDAERNALMDKYIQHGNISAALGGIALLFMAVARYL